MENIKRNKNPVGHGLFNNPGSGWRIRRRLKIPPNSLKKVGQSRATNFLNNLWGQRRKREAAPLFKNIIIYHLKKVELMNLKQMHNESSLYIALRAYMHPMRQDMLKLIEKEGKIKVTEIWKKLDSEQSKTSGFLAILRDANLVIATRKSKNIYYSVNKESITLLQVLSEHWDKNMNAKPIRKPFYVDDVDKINDGKRMLFQTQLAKTV